MSITRHWKIGVCLVAIFIAGAVTGAMITVRVAKNYIARQSNLERWAASALRDYEKRLNLTPEQAAKLRPVFDSTAKRLHEVRAETGRETLVVLRDMNDEVSRELTPDQQKRLEDIKKDFLARWRNQRVNAPVMGRKE